MKTGKTLSALAAEIERQADAKQDFIADTRAVSMSNDAKAITLHRNTQGAHLVNTFELNGHARGQLAERLQIPRPFFDRLATNQPDLLAYNVNELFRREPSKAMIRVLDDRVRGIMSNAFRPLDNYDLADAALPALQKAGAKIVSCDITETRLYIKATLPQFNADVPLPAGMEWGKGHNLVTRRILAAISIGNSEVGAGGLYAIPGEEEVGCTNLAFFNARAMKQVHLGKRQGAGDDGVREYLTDETKRAEDAAVWGRLRDYIAAMCDGRVFRDIVAANVAARGDKIEGDPAAVVEVFGKRQGLSEQERGGLLRYLVDSGETTRYGLKWAVTRLAEDSDSYDRASELEQLGGTVIDLPRNDWQAILKQAA